MFLEYILCHSDGVKYIIHNILLYIYHVQLFKIYFIIFRSSELYVKNQKRPNHNVVFLKGLSESHAVLFKIDHI